MNETLPMWSLTHWGRVTHICVSKLTVIASDNGLSPSQRQAIIWTSAGILLIGPLGTNFSEILIEIITFSFKKMHLKVSAKWRSCCLGLNVLTYCGPVRPYSSTELGQYWFRCHLSSWAIAWTNDDLLSIKPWEQISMIFGEKNFIPENAFRNVVCQMTAIFFYI